MHNTTELQKELIDYLNENGIAIKELMNKEDLTKVGTKPLMYIQFISNTYKEGKLHSFDSNFNLYFVNKTLSNGQKSELLDLLDKTRSLFVGARIEYGDSVSKENPVIIKDEVFTETKSYVFVYTMKISIHVRIKNANS